MDVLLYFNVQLCFCDKHHKYVQEQFLFHLLVCFDPIAQVQSTLTFDKLLSNDEGKYFCNAFLPNFPIAVATSEQAQLNVVGEREIAQ